MAVKCCTKLETAKERCLIVFQGHPSNFKVTRYKTSTILTQIWAFPDYRPVAAFKSLRFALFLKGSLGLAGGKYDYKNLFFEVLLFQVAFLIFGAILLFLLTLFCTFWLQYLVLFQSMEIWRCFETDVVASLQSLMTIQLNKCPHFFVFVYPLLIFSTLW